MPLIEGYSTSDFAFIDLTEEIGKYYAENSLSLIYAMKQLKAFIDASLPYDVLSEEEVVSNPSILSNYQAVPVVAGKIEVQADFLSLLFHQD